MTPENASEVWVTQYEKRRVTPDGPYKFEIGDFVRISHLRHPFTREYSIRWSGEIFKVVKRRVKSGLNQYEVSDLQDEKLQGTFWEPQLLKITADVDEGVFHVEKIIKRRHRRGQEPEIFVKWRFYPPKFNSWIKASDLE